MFSWPEWTEALSREIATAPLSSDGDTGDSYYHHWLAALESLVVEKGAASRATLASRKAAWARAAAATPHGEPILLANDPEASARGGRQDRDRGQVVSGVPRQERGRGMMDTEAMTERMTECACLRAGEPFIGKQGFTYAPAISAETVGASASICNS